MRTVPQEALVELETNSAAQRLDFVQINLAFEKIADYVEFNTPASSCADCLRRGEQRGHCVCQGKGWLSLTEIARHGVEHVI